MTLDAMHWVWTHSQAKGNARLALLYVADQVRTPACEVRLSYGAMAKAMRAPRSVVQEAVTAALELKELEIVEPKSGSRATLYRLPKAVDYVRSTGPHVPESGTRADPHVPDPGTRGAADVPGSGTREGSAEGSHVPDPGTPGPVYVPDSGTHYPSLPSKHEESQPDGSTGSDYGIPDAARPLVDSMTASGIAVRWPFSGDQWFPVLALIKKCGIPALVEYARRTADRTHVDSARYFMRGWAELPPRPAEGTPVYVPRPHLRAVGTPEERGIF